MHPSRSLAAFRCLLAALCLATAWPASARLITFDFTSTVKTVQDPAHLLDGSVRPGVTFNGSYTFDSEAAGNSWTTQTTYDTLTPGTGIAASVGNYTMSTFGLEAPLRIIVDNDNVVNTLGGDSYTVMGWGGLPSGSSLAMAAFSPVMLRDPTMTALTSTALPLAPPNPDDWSVRVGHIVWERTSDRQIATAWTRVDSLTMRSTPIPEPGSLALLALTALPMTALLPRRATRSSVG